ncbi:MAG: hypothetical protein QG610_549 [Euryarchaeota archaeon]|nr:hypothetical protein [Euryarchaeota archaeon]
MTNNQQPARLVGRGIKNIQITGDSSCGQVPEDLNKGPKKEPVIQIDSQFLKSVINTMVNPIFYKDKNGVFIGLNESYAGKVFGLPEEKIVGHTFLEICTMFSEAFDKRSKASGRCFTDICKEWNKSDLELLKSGGSKTQEQEVILADGTRGIFLVNKSTFKDKNGEVLGLVTVLQDITELRMSEKALQESDERYRIVTEQAGQLIYDNNLENNTLSLSGAVEEISGYSSGEAKKFNLKDWVDHIHPEDKEYVLEKFIEARKTGGRTRIEYRLRKKNGTYIYVEDIVTSLLNGNRMPYRILGVVQDITEQKLIRKQLERNEEKYRSFIQNFKGIAFQLNENLIPEFIHGAVEEITGYSEEDFMSGQISWEDLVYPEDQSAILKKIMRIKNSKYAYNTGFEYRIKCKGGKVKWVNELYQKIPGKNGEPDKYQGAIYDISEKKETEEALAEIKETRIKEIHHRIKNNLQVISSLLDLQAEKFEDKKVREAFRESQNRITSMGLIHEELYQEKGAETLNFAAYIQKLGESLFKTYRLDHPHVNMKTDLNEDVFLDVDAAVPLGIVVNELVSNSLKHAFPGKKSGEIQIRLSKIIKSEKGFDRVEHNEFERSGICVAVSDNGIGIPENVDIENPDTLGLQLVSTLVDQLDGELELKKNKGTEFRIWIDTREDF